MLCLRRRNNLKSKPLEGSNQAGVACSTPPALLRGQWVDDNNDRTLLEISGCSIAGTWLTNIRVPFTGFSSGTKLTMDFPDDSVGTGTVSDDGKRIDWDNGTSWYYVPISDCPIVTGYVTLAGVDYGGNDIGNFGTDIAHLSATCNQNSACLGFNRNGWEKASQIVLVESPGNCYYMKNALMPQPVSLSACSLPPNLLPGTWIDDLGDETKVVVSGCNVTGTWLTNYRPPFTGFSSGTKLTVDFSDGSPVSGTVSDDGKKITWDNDTFWYYVSS